MIQSQSLIFAMSSSKVPVVMSLVPSGMKKAPGRLLSAASIPLRAAWS